MPNDSFELDFEAIAKHRRTIKDHIAASTEVRGDTVEGQFDFGGDED
jgi:hypothetical protein